MAEMDAFERRLADTLLRYADEVPLAVDAAAVAHRVALEHPRRRATVLPRGLAGVPAVAWVLLVAALLAALAGTALVASRLLETAPRVPPLGAALVPTGIDTLTPETGWYARVVADGQGIFWALEDDGRLTRFDPATGSGRTWTVSDDVAFSMTDIAPARAGGVWLVGGRTLRWFDGAVFREVIDVPAEIAHAAEAADGSLWAATGEGDVLHWDGSSWDRLAPGRPSPDAYVTAIAVDTAGRPWIGAITQVAAPPDAGGVAQSGWVSRHDGSTWTTFDLNDAAPLGSPVMSIAELPDGAVWVATAGMSAGVVGGAGPAPGGGLARFDGSSWTDATAQISGARNAASVAAGPPGAIWVAAGDLNDGAVTVRRFDGRSWVSYGPSDGLPGPLESGFITAWPVPTKDGVYVGTGAGIFRLSGDRWERTWPATFAPTALQAVLALSRDELWAIGEKGLWHYRQGAWTSEPIDPRHPEGVVHALTLAPDGTLWARGTDGVAYRRDGRWVVADTAEASAIVVGRDGTVWAAGGSGEDGTGCEVRTLRFDGSAWVSRAIAGCPDFGVSSLAIDLTGALLAGTDRGWGGWGGTPGGVARFDERSWETIPEIGGSKIDGATILGTTPDGDVWVAADVANVPSPTGLPGAGQVLAARFDGTRWTTVELPEGVEASDYLAMAPDGALWTSVPTSLATGAGRGLARLDGEEWTFPFAATPLPWLRLASVAPDGTVFGWVASSIFRLPAPAPPP